MSTFWLVLCLIVVIAAVAMLVAMYMISPYTWTLCPNIWHVDVTMKPEWYEQQCKLFAQLVQKLDADTIPHWVVKETLVDIQKTNHLPLNRDVWHLAITHEYERQFSELRTVASADGVFVIQHTEHGPCIEISVMQQCDHEIVLCSSHDPFGQCVFNESHNHRNEIYLTSDVFPLQERDIDNVHVYLPHNASTCASIYETSNHTQHWKLWNNQRTKNVFAHVKTACGL